MQITYLYIACRDHIVRLVLDIKAFSPLCVDLDLGELEVVRVDAIKQQSRVRYRCQ